MAKTLESRFAALKNRDQKVEMTRDDEPKERLHTYIKQEQNRRLAHRAADKLGSKVQQTAEAIDLYLAVFDGAPLTPNMRKAIEARLAEEDNK